MITSPERRRELSIQAKAYVDSLPSETELKRQFDAGEISAISYWSTMRDLNPGNHEIAKTLAHLIA